MNPLIAKSSAPGRQPLSLVQHTVDVTEAGEALFGTKCASTRLGRSWLRFFRLAERDTRFFNNLLAACLFHDWGKANQQMQDMLWGRRQTQLFRHEHLSVLMLGFDGVEQWTRQRSDIDWSIVLAAVGSHHLRFGDTDFATEQPREAVRVCFDHSDFQQQLIPLVADRLGLPGMPVLPNQKYWGFCNEFSVFNPLTLREKLQQGQLREVTIASRDSNSGMGRMLNAVRSALIAADAVGSALRRTGQSIADWVQEQFCEQELCDRSFVDAIINRRITDLRSRSKWKDWNQFQSDCEGLPSRSLLLAPCGSGKTLAAWRWIAGQVQQRPVKRILFLYPTRATATEGFKDYVSWAPETDAALIHGTAEYDLEGMFSAEDLRSERTYDETDPRMFALRFWSKRVFSATVDQFLAFLSYGYGPMCLLPALTDSVIVVDECHSFDHNMFSALLGFLKTFDVPVLCMTATLQSGRKSQLSALLSQTYEDRPGELSLIARAPRYQVRRLEAQKVEQAVRKAVAAGKRVLWVVNQVARAQAAAAGLTNIGVPLICYHSRFKLGDRVERHRETVGAIRAGQPAAVVVSTQVCEMSLDIDADVLITEECPISSLIQRMGRCRRGRDELKTKGPGEVFVYAPLKEVVYTTEDLNGVSAFLADLQAKTVVSQSDLETGMHIFGSKSAAAPRLNSFLSSGAYAVSGVDSFRDIEAFNVSSVLNSELEQYLSASKEEQPGYIVPVPKKLKPLQDPRLPPYLFVADESHYDPKTGYWDQPIP